MYLSQVRPLPLPRPRSVRGERPQVYAWALRLAAVGHPIPAAEAAAQRIGLDWQRFVAAEKAEMDARAAAKASAQAAGEEGVLV